MKGKLLEYGLLVGEEHQQGRRISYWNMECLLVMNANKCVVIGIWFACW
jgi:hypothetical protein